MPAPSTPTRSRSRTHGWSAVTTPPSPMASHGRTAARCAGSSRSGRRRSPGRTGRPCSPRCRGAGASGRCWPSRRRRPRARASGATARAPSTIRSKQARRLTSRPKRIRWSTAGSSSHFDSSQATAMNSPISRKIRSTAGWPPCSAVDIRNSSRGLRMSLGSVGTNRPSPDDREQATLEQLGEQRRVLVGQVLGREPEDAALARVLLERPGEARVEVVDAADVVGRVLTLGIAAEVDDAVVDLERDVRDACRPR